MSRPILVNWDGDVLRPVGRMINIAREEFAPGRNYTIEQISDRSQRFHNYYFAWLGEAWANLPEIYDGAFSDYNRLRKWALIETGQCNVVVNVFRTRREAERYMAALFSWDSDVRCERIRTRVIAKRAVSQDFKSMTQKQFRASAELVMDLVAKMIGTDRETIGRNVNHA